jgi:GntR family transcriptional repressor for pyruvate dehydrogenase complex
MEFKTIRRSTTPRIVIDEILKAVKSGSLKPGDKLPSDRDLAKMFGVGRGSVREAITALVILGLMEVLPGRGTFIKADFKGTASIDTKLDTFLSEEDILDLIEIRECLEVKAIEVAAEKADKKDMDRIGEAINRMKETKDDMKSFFRADYDFHIAIAEACGNVVLVKLIRMFVEMMHKRYKELPESLTSPDNATVTAEQVLNHLMSGDGEKAAESMRDHFMV